MSISKEDMLNELCHIACMRNVLQRKRQQIRSKKNYYSNILESIVKRKNYPKVPAKYKKLSKRVLIAKIKTYTAQMLLVEVDLYNLSVKTTTTARKYGKELGLVRVTCSGSNKILAFRSRNSWKWEISSEEIKSRAHDFQFEEIILKNEGKEFIDL